MTRAPVVDLEARWCETGDIPALIADLRATREESASHLEALDVQRDAHHAEAAALRERVAELEAVLLNERGLGEGPPGWALDWGVWRRPIGAPTRDDGWPGVLQLRRQPSCWVAESINWRIAVLGPPIAVRGPTARAAMLAANLALPTPLTASES